MRELGKVSYEFGPFRLDPLKRVLFREGNPIPLMPKSFETLLMLVEHRDRVMDKEELMRALWPDTIVEEANLAQNIFRLRRALGETPEDHRYVLTIPGRGYRFVAEVNELADQDEDVIVEERTHTVIEQCDVHPGNNGFTAGGVWERAKLVVFNRNRTGIVLGLFGSVLILGVVGAALLRGSGNGSSQKEVQPGPKSLAVLPFISLNNGVDDDYLGLGIADTLITKLSNLRELVVRPTGSVRKYMTLDQDPIVAGREQQVDSVLEGSIQRAGERIRVTVRLINLPDGRPIWAYQCDEQQCADIFALQDAIAQQVAEALILDLSGAEHQALAKHYTEDREAYDLYLRGRFFLGKRSAGAIEKSRHYFQQAIRRDPNFALAYTGLAESYAGYLIRQDNLASAMAAAIRALEIDDTLAEAHTALGLLSWQFEWNWEQADREFRRALELNPRYPAAHNWYSVFLSTVERHEEALSHARQAQALDPFSTHSKVHLGLVFYAARQTDQAMLEWRKALELDPYRPNLHANLGRCYVQKRQYQEALQEFNKEIEVGGSKLICDAYIAFVNAVSGRRAEALSKLDELTKQSDQQAVAFYKAMIYAGLDDRDKVFEWLEVAYAERTGPLWYRLNVDPWWDKVRTDPRFVDILRRMRLPIPSGGNTGRS